MRVADRVEGGRFRVEVSRYLANAQYTGNSAKAWYLLAEPVDLPVIEMALSESLTSTEVRLSVRLCSNDHFLEMLAALSATAMEMTLVSFARREVCAAAARMTVN